MTWDISVVSALVAEACEGYVTVGVRHYQREFRRSVLVSFYRKQLPGLLQSECRSRSFNRFLRFLSMSLAEDLEAGPKNWAAYTQPFVE
jgi:hypothetical protein